MSRTISLIKESNGFETRTSIKHTVVAFSKVAHSSCTSRTLGDARSALITKRRQLKHQLNTEAFTKNITSVTYKKILGCLLRLGSCCSIKRFFQIPAGLQRLDMAIS